MTPSDRRTEQRAARAYAERMHLPYQRALQELRWLRERDVPHHPDAGVWEQPTVWEAPYWGEPVQVDLPELERELRATSWIGKEELLARVGELRAAGLERIWGTCEEELMMLGSWGEMVRAYTTADVDVTVPVRCPQLATGGGDGAIEFPPYVLVLPVLSSPPQDVMNIAEGLWPTGALVELCRDRGWPLPGRRAPLELTPAGVAGEASDAELAAMLADEARLEDAVRIASERHGWTLWACTRHGMGEHDRRWHDLLGQGLLHWDGVELDWPPTLACRHLIEVDGCEQETLAVYCADLRSGMREALRRAASGWSRNPDGALFVFADGVPCPFTAS